MRAVIGSRSASARYRSSSPWLQPGEQHPAHRGRVGREPGADRDRHCHDPLGRHPGHVDDVVTVEHRDRRRLAHPGDKLLQVRRGHLGHGQARQVGVAELQHARAQRELPAVIAHIAELHQRQQEPSSRRPGQPGRPGDLAEAQPFPVRAEGPDHRQPAIQGLDEVTVPGLAAVCGQPGQGGLSQPSPRSRRLRCSLCAQKLSSNAC